MRSFKGVRGGTPSGEPLCRTCRNALYVRGKSLSEERLLCKIGGDRNGVMTWEAFECSYYDDKGYPPIHQLEQMAWILEISKTREPIGFLSPEERRRRGACEIPSQQPW